MPRPQQGFDLDGERFAIKASIGISVWPADGHTSEELLAVADASMYREKRSARSADVSTAGA